MDNRKCNDTHRLRKGDHVKDREGHEGQVVAVYPAQNKVRVRWHKGFASEEFLGALEPL